MRRDVIRDDEQVNGTFIYNSVRVEVIIWNIEQEVITAGSCR